MKYIKLVCITLSLLFSLLFLGFDVKFSNISIQILFYILYFLINFLAIINLNNINNFDSFIIIFLAINLMICCYSESFAIFIMLVFLAVFSFVKKYKRRIKMFFTALLCLNAIIIVFVLGISNTIVEKTIEKKYNENGSISINIIYLDFGATGSSYLYQAEFPVIKGYISITKTVTKSKNISDVQWVNDKTVRIGNKDFKVT